MEQNNKDPFISKRNSFFGNVIIWSPNFSVPATLFKKKFCYQAEMEKVTEAGSSFFPVTESVPPVYCIVGGTIAAEAEVLQKPQ